MNLKGTLILILLIADAWPAASQFKNVLVDAVAGDCEVAIATNPRRPDNIVVGFPPDRLFFTKNGGETWQKAGVESPLGVSGTPALLADDKGNFYYFHLPDPSEEQMENSPQKMDRIVVRWSGDGGETWSPGESIGVNHPKHQMRPWATADGRGNLYVAWTQADTHGNADPACQSNILFSMSKNGKKWSSPVVISQLPGDCTDSDNTAVGATPAVTIDGKVIIAWSARNKIYLDRSFNGGEWWLSNDIVVAEQKGGWQLNIPGYDYSSGAPVLMTDKSKSPYRGSLYISWADQRNGENDSDIWFSRSHNFGDNWSLATRVNDDEPGKHQYMPWMTVDQSTGFIYIVYYDRRNHDDNSTDVYLAYSRDGGASFKNKLVSEKPFVPTEDVSSGAHISISAHNGIITPAWTRQDEGKASVWMAVIKHEQLEKP